MHTDTEFPDDENGEVLRRMKLGGDDLSKVRDIDFSLIFENELDVRKFLESIKEKGYRTAYESIEYDGSVVWDVTVTTNMIPSHKEIEAFEHEFQALASRFGGRNDGWGCFRQPAV